MDARGDSIGPSGLGRRRRRSTGTRKTARWPSGTSHGPVSLFTLSVAFGRHLRIQGKARRAVRPGRALAWICTALWRDAVLATTGSGGYRPRTKDGQSAGQRSVVRSHRCRSRGVPYCGCEQPRRAFRVDGLVRPRDVRGIHARQSRRAFGGGVCGWTWPASEGRSPSGFARAGARRCHLGAGPRRPCGGGCCRARPRDARRAR